MNGFQMKITIKGSKPPIWRRLIIPVKATFEDLHCVIQEIFGWEDEHLWEFKLDDGELTIVMDSEDDDWSEDYDDRLMASECSLRQMLEEGEKFKYIYDFGDWWEHDIKVEKLVKNSGDMVKVIKAKGADMIEDCGGIWGYYDRIETANPFDMDAVNAVLAGLPMGKFSYAAVKLKDVLLQYTRENLSELAKLHGVKMVQGMKKQKLAETIEARLLDEDYMRLMIELCETDTLEIFEDAIEEEGIECLKEEIEDSLFLCSYGVYIESEAYLVPVDVAQRYQKIYTPEYKIRLEERQKWKKYCESAVYLYGVLPVDKMAEIFNQYEVNALDKNELETYLTAVTNSYEQRKKVVIKDGFVMDPFLANDEVRTKLMEAQEDVLYYIPETKQEFLQYGEMQSQELDEYFAAFVAYLQEKMELDFEEAVLLMFSAQEAIRKDWPWEYVTEISGMLDIPQLNRRMQKLIFGQMEILKRHIRLWKLRGFTQEEMFPVTAKVIPFRNKK